MTHLAHPGYLWLLLLLVPLIVWYVRSQRDSEPSLQMSTTRPFDQVGYSWKAWLRHVLFGVRLAALATLVIILCRPQSRDSWSATDVEGTDIVLSLDVSTSMLAKDFSPNRFEAAKDVATKFVSGREHDNIGLVVFAGESFTQVPMTMDNAQLVNAIGQTPISFQSGLEDGTAIGDGIATAINRIRNGKAKSKSIILITDGTNNTGIVAPLTAAKIAQQLGVKIYTIGVGSNGSAEVPVAQDFAGDLVYQRMPVTIDEATLRQIASTTGGKYFRATGNRVLREIFAEIDKLEKSHLEEQKFSHTEDNYLPWALLLLILVLADVVCRYTLLRHIP